MQEVISQPLQPTQPNKKSKRNLIVIGMIMLAIIIVGFFIFRSSQTSNQTTVTPTPTEAPTPTQKPKIDKSKVRIQVVNGTGTPGQASKVVETLTKAGYSADLIKTGNAEEFSTTPTTITARAGFEDTAQDIKSLLDTTFDKITVKSSSLEESSDFDIVIVTGGDKFEEPTATVTPTGTAVSPTPTTTVSTTPTPTSTPTPTP